ncbi:hypothetical protein CKO41_05810 [Thiococcus pfennigii]|nr:hypothetical protein [Thiococcus pfennigii]
MRQTTDDIAGIRNAVQTHLGAGSQVWLLGSRLDDDTRGGDIDIYIEPAGPLPENLLLPRQTLRAELERRLGRPARVFNLAGLTLVSLMQFSSGPARTDSLYSSMSCRSHGMISPSKDRGAEKCVKAVRLNSLASGRPRGTLQQAHRVDAPGQGQGQGGCDDHWSKPPSIPR